MIYKNFVRNKLEILLDLLSNNQNLFLWKFDKNDANSYCDHELFDENRKLTITIGTRLLERNILFVPNYIFAELISNIFHEYKHFEQYKAFQKACKEGEPDFDGMSQEEILRMKESFISMMSRERFGDYYDPNNEESKYGMTPFELQAEIAGIEGAKAYFDTFDKNFDFSKAICESIVKRDSWFGPDRYNKNKRPSDLKNAFRLLHKWAEEAYDYPCKVIDQNFKGDEERGGNEYALECSRLTGSKQYALHLENMKKIGEKVPFFVVQFEKELRNNIERKSEVACFCKKAIAFGNREEKKKVCKTCEEEECEERV